MTLLSYRRLDTPFFITAVPGRLSAVAVVELFGARVEKVIDEVMDMIFVMAR